MLKQRVIDPFGGGQPVVVEVGLLEVRQRRIYGGTAEEVEVTAQSQEVLQATEGVDFFQVVT